MKSPKLNKPMMKINEGDLNQSAREIAEHRTKMVDSDSVDNFRSNYNDIDWSKKQPDRPKDGIITLPDGTQIEYKDGRVDRIGRDLANTPRPKPNTGFFGADD